MALGIRGLAALALAGGVAVGGIALAQGPNMNLPVFGITPGTNSPYAKDFLPQRAEPMRANYDDGAELPRARDRTRSSGAVASFGYGKPVCVRLCDGFFFPTASVSGGEAACAAQCPDAPTALYTMPTDRIEDAVSSTGAPYSRLPVAKRYQTSFESTCTCHRDTVASRAKELLTDTTLRRGDVVMTANGFRVYEGRGYGPSGPGDFVALSKALGLPKAERASLVAMERASAGARAPAAPSVVAKRPKGNVTVDNGRPELRR